jgi:hypothetical protein
MLTSANGAEKFSTSFGQRIRRKSSDAGSTKNDANRAVRSGCLPGLSARESEYICIQKTIACVPADYISSLHRHPPPRYSSQIELGTRSQATSSVLMVMYLLYIDPLL